MFFFLPSEYVALVNKIGGYHGAGAAPSPALVSLTSEL
uniref:Uncharacterized protein n=1 Tax=Anguilla anguilla TaxID=7936 RepID=A0A0E9TLD5_ANGAN